MERNIAKDLTQLFFTSVAVNHGGSHIMKNPNVLAYFISQTYGKILSRKGNELANNCVKIKSLLHAIGMKCFLLKCLAVFLKQALKNIICKKEKSEA